MWNQKVESKNKRTGKRDRVPKKSIGILDQRNLLVVYDFIDNNKKYFELRCLCRNFGISTNGYYNYLEDNKHDYYEQRKIIYKRIKYIYYYNNRTILHRVMCTFLLR